jgi:predicted phosphodiesterase
MKLAILSDLHGNLPALQSVTEHVETWRPDHVIVNGDTVNRGPSSAACWDWLESKRQASGWQILYGNHEGYVLDCTRPDLDPGQINRMSHWTFRQMDGRVPSLAALPEMASFSGPDGSELRIRHASMLGERDGLYHDTPDEQMRQKIVPAPAVFCTGHTHIPFVRRVDDTLIVNAGAVGSPCDGDRRASYAQVEWRGGEWRAHIARVPYDMAQAERDFRTSGVLHQTEPFTLLLYHEWRTARGVVIPYWRQYRSRVQAGELDEATAVLQFLCHNNLTTNL